MMASEVILQAARWDENGNPIGLQLSDGTIIKSGLFISVEGALVYVPDKSNRQERQWQKTSRRGKKPKR